MGQLIGPLATEPISFAETVTESDGAGGRTGTLATVHTCLATVRILKGSRLLDAAQTSLRQGYEFGIWVDPAFEPKPGSIITYRDEQLSISEYRYEDNSKRRYLIKALEGAPGNG